MANKRRAKKYKVPFRKYGPNGIISTKLSANDFKEKRLEDAKNYKSKYYNYRDDEDMFYTYSYGKNPSDNNVRDYYENTETSPSNKELISNDELKKGEMRLPLETIEIILQFLSFPDGINLKFFLVCKSWYKICLKILYENPVLNSLNFNKFVESVTNATIVSYINYEYTEKYFKRMVDSGMTNNGGTVLSLTTQNSKRHLKYSKTPIVKNLDLSNIVQAGKNSNVTKILRRCSPNLISLIAPQSSFGITSMNILKMCHNLTILDLSLVSETVNLGDLLNSIKSLNSLTTLKFPRSSINCSLSNSSNDAIGHQVNFQWPINLQNLKLSGGITNDFLMDLNFPEKLDSLELQHCPLIDDYSIYYLLSKIGFNLKLLSIIYPMPKLKENSLDLVFKYCPFLENMEIFVDYISQWCFSEVNFPWIVNSKFIPEYKYKSQRDTVLVDGEQKFGGLGYGPGKNRLRKKKYCIDPEDRNERLRDIIISTTTNYFEEDEEDEDDGDDDEDRKEENFEEKGDDINDPNEDKPKSNIKTVLNYEKYGLKSLRKLKYLYLGSSGTLGQANKVQPDDLIIALGESRLPNLTTLKVSNRVGWNQGEKSLDQLVELLDYTTSGSIYMCP